MPRLRVLALIVAAACAGAGSQALRAQEKAGDAPPAPYGETPDDLVPFRAVEPARRYFTKAPEFRGPGREDPAPAGLTSVKVGLVAPLSGPDEAQGRRMRQGVELAFADANAAGGFGADKLPFEAVAVDEGVRWGQAGDALVDLVDRDGVWAVIGAYEDANSHVMTRVVLKVQVANVNTAGVDPTLTEHNVPWVLRVRPDDRRTSYRLVRKVFVEDKRTRVVMFRANDRYGRTGVAEFIDAARRLHHPVPLEVRYEAADGDFASRIERIREANADAIVVWGRPGPTGTAVRALRAAGITAQIYAPDRVADPAYVQTAGAAAEGTIFTYPMDPRTGGRGWDDFRKRYSERFGEEPDATAAFAYDGATMVVQAVRRTGLNRPRIRDELYAPRTYDGVTGTIKFDATQNDVSPVILGRVTKGRFVFGDVE